MEDDDDDDDDDDEYYVCHRLFECFLYIVDITFKDDGGFAGRTSNTKIGAKLLFDFLYIFIILILVIQIISGIIIDTFA